MVWQPQDALYRTMFKQEELVEFVRAASSSEEEFDRSVAALHEALDKAVDKVRSKHPAEISMVGQVDALIDTLYLTYGSFVLMGVDPEEVFEIVHRANMGKIFPDGRAHFDPVTHKILKPDDWEEKYAPEPAIQKRTRSPAQGLRKNTRNKKKQKKTTKKFGTKVPNFFFLTWFYPYRAPLVSLLWRGEGCILRRIRPLSVRMH